MTRGPLGAFRRIPLLAALCLCLGLCLGLGSGAYLLARTQTPANVPVLDLDPKGHLAESLARSSYDLSDLRLSTDTYTHILLTAAETGRDEPYLMRLRDGTRAVTFPHPPMRGDLYVSRSLIQEVDVQFYNFAATGPAGTITEDLADGVLTSPQEDIDAILAIHALLESFGWDSFPGHCFHNRFPDDDPGDCLDRMVFDPAGDTALRDLLERYVARLRAASAADDVAALDRLGPLVLGGWTMSDGTLVRATVAPRRDARGQGARLPLSEHPFNLALRLNSFSQYAALQAGALGRCFGGQGMEILPHRFHTPEQAQRLFGTLYDRLGPPELGATLIEDPLRQERFAWGLDHDAKPRARHSTYFTARAWDRHYTTPRAPGGAMPGQLTLCDLVPALEAEME